MRFDEYERERKGRDKTKWEQGWKKNKEFVYNKTGGVCSEIK